MSAQPDTPPFGDVADPPICHFCSSSHLEWHGIWADCRDCTASFAYRHGLITDTEPPHDMDAVSDLLHNLQRRGDV